MFLFCDIIPPTVTVMPYFVCLFLSCPLTKTYYRLIIPSPPEGAFELQYGGPREGRLMWRIWHFSGLLCLSGVYAKKTVTCCPRCCRARPMSGGGGLAYKPLWDSERRQGERNSGGASTHHHTGQQVGVCVCVCVLMHLHFKHTAGTCNIRQI